MSSSKVPLACTSARAPATSEQKRNDPPMLISDPVSLIDPNSLVTNTFDQSSPQAFCLRWNNFQSNMLTVFEYLYQNEKFVDCTLACDGTLIKAHKMVLSASSPYFEKIFADTPCPHPVIIVKDIAPLELKQIVEFMYKGEINVHQDEIQSLLQVAEVLKVRGLVDTTDKSIASSESAKETIAKKQGTAKMQKSVNLQKRPPDVSSTDSLVSNENYMSTGKKRKTNGGTKKTYIVDTVYPEEDSINCNIIFEPDLDNSLDVQSTIPVIDIREEPMTNVSFINQNVSTIYLCA